MPKGWKDIIEEVMNGEDQSLRFKFQQLMQDPSQMEITDSFIPDNAAPVPNADNLYNPQTYDTMRAPERQDALMNPGFMLDKMRPGTKYDDTQTAQQEQRRERQLNDNVFRNSRTPTINPDLQERDGFSDLFPPPTPRNLPEAYNQLPEQRRPGSNMPEVDPQTLIDNYMKNQDILQGNSTMQELMNFYTYGGQET